MFPLKQGISVILGLLIITLAACNPQSAVTPTQINPGTTFTAVAQTVFAQLTLTATYSPKTPTPSLTPQPTLTRTIAPTGTPAPSQAPLFTPTSTVAICDAAQFVTDVTVPDNTNFAPGESFKKTWRLKNAGTCSWTTDYSIVFTTGERLGGPDFITMPKVILPNEAVDISVDLKAPTTAGTYQSNWKIRNAQGIHMGVLPNGGAIWAKITVGASGTTTVTTTPAPGSTSPAVTPSTTPVSATVTTTSATATRTPTPAGSTVTATVVPTTKTP